MLPALPITAGVAFIAAAAGDQVGFLFGRRIGPTLFSRPQRRLFNPANAHRASEFFDKHGPKAILLARFVPIVRTFTPIVAGVGEMSHTTFTTYNLVGAAVWGIGVTTLGFFLGEVPVVRDNLEIAAIVIVLVSIAPMVIEAVRHRRASPTRRS